MFANIRFPPPRPKGFGHPQVVAKTDTYIAKPRPSTAQNLEPLTEREWSINDGDGPHSDEHEVLEKHPLVAQSFATFPPTSHLFIFDIAGRMPNIPELDTEDNGGVTVLDVVSNIYPELDKPLTAYDVSEYLERHEDCIPKNWTVREAVASLGTLRQIMRVCPIEGLWIEEIDPYVGPMCELTMS
ncbi:hypothetical protein C8Q79DRAFT_1121967 [Trametes meyenii]|nr:hypothetical protein C8Q79DRAFT_1121967 [Trametes meyenii]